MINGLVEKRHMCWNRPVSICFATAEAVLLLIIALSPSSWAGGFGKHYLPAGISVFIVEAAEAFVWPSVPAHLPSNGGCPSANQHGTLLLLLAVATQPMCAAWNALRPPAGKPHPHANVLRVLLWAGFLNFLFKVFAILLSSATRSPAESPLCAYKGPHGHMIWHYWGGLADTLRSFFPNSFFHFLCFFASIACMCDKVEALFVLGFTCLYFVFYALWSPGEAESMWCWSGISLDLCYAIYPPAKSYFGWQTVSTWTGLFTCTTEPQSPKYTATTLESMEVQSIEVRDSYSYGSI